MLKSYICVELVIVRQGFSFSNVSTRKGIKEKNAELVIVLDSYGWKGEREENGRKGNGLEGKRRDYILERKEEGCEL